MTASKTPNLGLMSPVLSDAFTPDDFDTTFGILDANPGILTVPNQAARPSGYSAAQHGRMVWQADQNIMWIWTQPSSLTAGSWQRQGTKGWLGGATNAAGTSTTAISWGTAPTVMSATVMVPGGRPQLIIYRWVFIYNDPAKYATLNMFANGGGMLETRHNGNSFSVAYSSTYPYPPDSGTFCVLRGSSGVQESVTFQLKIRCQDPAVVGGAQGGGTSTINQCSMDIFEL